MIRCNLHTHTRFSDGSGTPEQYCEEAIRQGFSVLGFSDHSPVPFENTFAIKLGHLDKYVDSILKLKEKFNSQEQPFRVFLGLEIDYIPGVSDIFAFLRNNYPFDYLIGSVHLVKNENTGKLWFIDGPEISIYDKGLQEVFGGDIRLAVTTYFRQLQSMIRLQKPDIIGHLDKIKMYNRGRYFSEKDPWYLDLIKETLELIKENRCVAEVNTRGLYKKRAETFFPGPEILGMIKQLNIPVTVVSDAHKPSELSMGFDDAYITLKSLGFRSTTIMTTEGFTEIKLS